MVTFLDKETIPQSPERSSHLFQLTLGDRHKRFPPDINQDSSVPNDEIHIIYTNLLFLDSKVGTELKHFFPDAFTSSFSMSNMSDALTPPSGFSR